MLNAISGILSLFQNVLGGEMIAGMPELAMDQALLWRPLNEPIRIPFFPSWSWAGWSGECRWPYALQTSALPFVKEYSWSTVYPRKVVRRAQTNSGDTTSGAGEMHETNAEQATPFEVLYFDAEVVKASVENLGYLPIDSGKSTKREFVLLSRDLLTQLNNVMLIEWSGQYAERVDLWSVSTTAWQKAERQLKSIALK